MSEDESDPEITAEEYSAYEREYWRVVAETEGFDCDEYKSPVVLRTGLLPFRCQDSYRYPYPLLVKCYALLGLHRYNMLEGTSIALSTLQKFNKSMNYASSFYITFLAHDPATTPSTIITFQVRVDEQEYGSLDLTVSVARPKKSQNEVVTTKRPFIPHFHGGAVADGIFRGELPDWPSKFDLKDSKRFYVLNETDLQDNDWISLYLELLICSTDRNNADTKPSVLSQLRIRRVYMETKEEDGKTPNERINAKNAHVYITFDGLPESPELHEIGESVVRRGIIRRVINESTGYLSLLGKFWSGKNIEQRFRSGEKARVLKNDLP